MVAPGAVDEAAGEWQLIGAALVFAQPLDRLIRRRLSFAVEFSQPFFARRHLRPTPSVAPSASLAFHTCRIGSSPDASIRPLRANEVSVWYPRSLTFGSQQFDRAAQIHEALDDRPDRS